MDVVAPALPSGVCLCRSALWSAVVLAIERVGGTRWVLQVVLDTVGGVACAP